MTDVFLSYAREDRTFAEALAKALECKGWSIWWDQRLEAGEVWDEVIESNIEAARIVLVLWSPTSVKKSWVKKRPGLATKTANSYQYSYNRRRSLWSSTMCRPRTCPHGAATPVMRPYR